MALDDEITKLVKDYDNLEDLAEHRLQRIEILEAGLVKEKSNRIFVVRDHEGAKRVRQSMLFESCGED